MNKLILLLLVSCASTPNPCKYSRTETFAGTTYVEYKCPESYKYCKYDSEGRKIDCFSTRQK